MYFRLSCVCAWVNSILMWRSERKHSPVHQAHRWSPRHWELATARNWALAEGEVDLKLGDSMPQARRLSLRRERTALYILRMTAQIHTHLQHCHSPSKSDSPSVEEIQGSRKHSWAKMLLEIKFTSLTNTFQRIHEPTIQPEAKLTTPQ